MIKPQLIVILGCLLVASGAALISGVEHPSGPVEALSIGDIVFGVMAAGLGLWE